MAYQRPPSPPNSNNGELRYSLGTHEDADQLRFGAIGDDMTAHAGSYDASSYPVQFKSPFMGQGYDGQSDMSKTFQGFNEHMAQHPSIVQKHGVASEQFRNFYPTSAPQFGSYPGSGMTGIPIDDHIKREVKETHQPPTPNSSGDSPAAGYSETRPARYVTPLNSAVQTRKKSARGAKRPTKVTKHRKPSKSDKTNLPMLEKPLSQISQSFKVDALKEAEAIAYRSIQVRHEERTTKHKGKIPRPKNGFILYRTVSAQRVLTTMFITNHQLISKLCGKSWGMEPLELKERYKQLAEKDREMHLKAFPGYKFTPTKNDVGGGKKAKKNFSGEDFDEELEVSDYEATQNHRFAHLKTRPSAPRVTRANNFSASYSPGYQHDAVSDHIRPVNGMALQQYHSPSTTNHQSSFDRYYSNGLPPYQMADMEQMRLGAQPGTALNQSVYYSLPGLPAGAQSETARGHAAMTPPAAPAAVDPQLLAFNDSPLSRPENAGAAASAANFGNGDPGSRFDVLTDPVHDSQRDFSFNHYLGDSNTVDYNQLPGFHESMQPATDDVALWQSHVDHGGEFEKWLPGPGEFDQNQHLFES